MAVVDGKVKKGSLARVEPEGKVMRMWEAIETYMERKQPLIIIAGADYGQGSSRDWAAKGVRLAGVEAIVAEGFERIHRTNLIGMGVLPLEFKPGTNRKTLGLDGTETFDVIGERTPRADLTAGHPSQRRTRRSAGDLPPRHRRRSVIYDAGGVLQRFAQDFLAKAGDRPRACLRTELTRRFPHGPGHLLSEEAGIPHPRTRSWPHHPQFKHPATYMRGGTSKGVFFACRICRPLPGARRSARRAAAARDRQPRPLWQAHRRHGRRHLQHQQVRDPVQKQQPDHDVDYLLRPGLHRQGLRRLERQLRQPLHRRRRRSRSCRAGRSGAGAAATASAWCASGRPTSARPSSPMCR
jgi:hypothetical protein